MVQEPGENTSLPLTQVSTIVCAHSAASIYIVNSIEFGAFFSLQLVSFNVILSETFPFWDLVVNINAEQGTFG